MNTLIRFLALLVAVILLVGLPVYTVFSTAMHDVNRVIECATSMTCEVRK